MFNLNREFIFGDERPFAQCHAATLVEQPKRGAFAAWFGGTREGLPDVGIWASTRASGEHVPHPQAPGASWTPPRCIAKVSDAPHWNPVLYDLAPSGTHAGARPNSQSDTELGKDLILQFKVGQSIRNWVTWIMRSIDGGESWQKPQPLDLEPDLDHPEDAASRSAGSRDESPLGRRGGRGPVRCKPIRLASGDWLAGASVESRRRWDAFFDRSENGIDRWRATRHVELDRSSFSGKGLIQPALWESEPGQIHAVFRSTDGRIYRADSKDDGAHFSPAYAMDLPNNNSGLDVAQLKGGCLALACNPVAGNWAERTPLSILFSWDNGASWPERIEIETDPGEFSYPAILATGPAGQDLALIYTWNRRRIAYLRIPADELPSAPKS